MLVLIAIAFGAPLGAGTARQKEHGSKHESSKGKIITEPEGHPLLWKEPVNIEGLDLFYGPGGRKGAPDLSGRFTYVGVDTHGTQKKIYVNDDKGREWIVKFGPEARPETAATRIVWAMGYHVDDDYFVRKVHIDGMEGGDATNVRFKRRHNGYKDVGLWKWEHNPFTGTRELDGLKVLMAVMNNWDLKSDNNKVVRPNKKSRGDAEELIYYVGDLGATFGKTGSLAHELHFPGHPPAGTKDNPSEFARQSFIKQVRGGNVHFHYKGKDPAALRGVWAENARWMGNLLGRLSVKQLRDAFRAAGYEDSEASVLVQAMQDRIGELQSVK
ncbi:MAG TPA: hypothetical protein VEZ90_15840 [Blastocatellia bacterium]|nr:hypothetical protein [Blastocatellia bacterium]